MKNNTIILRLKIYFNESFDFTSNYFRSTMILVTAFLVTALLVTASANVEMNQSFLADLLLHPDFFSTSYHVIHCSKTSKQTFAAFRLFDTSSKKYPKFSVKYVTV